MHPTLRLATLAALTLAPLGASAQTAGTCAPGTAVSELNTGNVRASLFNVGRLFWNGGATSNLYNVPRSATGRPNALFVASLWVGGLVDGQVRIAGAGYGQSEYWPGPLTVQGTLPNASDCTPYDRIFRITRADLDAYTASGATTADLREWPAAWGAPVVDGDGIAGNYDLAAGDRPQLWGDETAWWVMNDVGNVKRSTGTVAMGLEVQVTAFAFNREGVLGNTTFYRYALVNRSTRPIRHAYAGLWVDADLGNSTDDYAGSDSARSLAYVYNADNNDEGTDGYGTSPPAIGLRFVEGPLVDADGDDTWRDPDGTLWRGRRRLPMTVAGRMAKAAISQGDPRAGTTDIYQALQGLSNDGAPMRACGDGFATAASDCPVTRFQYHGDPETRQGWSMLNLFPSRTPLVAASPNDQRMMGAVGPFEIQPGERQTLTAALVYARGGSHLNTVTVLKRASDTVQDAWNSGVATPTAVAQTPEAGAIALGEPRPNPSRGPTVVPVTLPAAGTIRVEAIDALGRRVAVLHDGAVSAGTTALAFDTDRLPAGVYVVRLTAGDASVVRRLVVTH